MGTVSRHSNYPYQDGETLSGADLETDINNIVTEINGNLDNSNIDSSADISGSKLADNSVTNAKLQNSTVTTAKISSSAVVQAYVSTATGTETATTSTALADVTGVTDATLTIGSTDDIIKCTMYMTLTPATVGATSQMVLGFAVNGTDTNDVAISESFGTTTPYDADFTVSAVWAQTAPATGAIVIKPRYRRYSAGNVPSFSSNITTNRVFTVEVIPNKP